MAEPDNDQAVADYIAWQNAQEEDRQLAAQLSRGTPKEYHQQTDPKTGMRFNVEKTMDWQPPPTEVPAEAPVAAAAAPIASGGGDLASMNEMAAIRDPRQALIYTAGQKGGDFKKGHTITTEGAIPDDPEQAAWRAQSHAAKQGIADQEADIAIQKNIADQAMLEQTAAQQQLAMQDQAAKLAAREAAVDKSMGELDATIQQHIQQWQRGTSTGSELFDGSFGAGNMLSVIGITLAGMGGPEYQANAMAMVNKSLDRAIEAQRFGVDSMFRQLQNKTGSAEIARESMKMMQLKYAETMADLYAAKNLTPQIAINLARLKVQLADQYMAAEAKVRELTIGKITLKEEFKHQEEIKGGWHAPRTQEEQLKALQIDQQFFKNVAASQKLLGADDNVKLAPGDAKAMQETAEYDGSINLMTQGLVAMGGKIGADGKIDPDSLKGANNLTGFGLGAGLHDIFQPEKSSAALNQFRLGINAASKARRRGQASAEALKMDEKLAMGGTFEADQVASAVNFYNTIVEERNARISAASPQAQDRYERSRAANAERARQSMGDAGLRTKEVQ